MRIRAAVVGLVVLLTVVTLGAVLRDVDLGAAEAALASFHWVWMLPAIGLYLATFFLRTWRFQRLLDVEVPYRGVLSVVAVGYLAINVVPLRMGELVRPYLLWEKWRVPVAVGGAAVVIERLLDMIAMLTMLLLVGALVDLPPGGIVVHGIDILAAGQHVLTVFVAVGLLGLFVTLVAGPPAVDLIERAVARVSPKLAGRVGRLGRDLVSTLRGLARSPARTAFAIVTTVGLWVGMTLAVASLLNGFPGLGATFDRALVTWTGTMTAVVLVPTPGFIGSFEAGGLGSLVLLGVPADLARAYAVLLHASVFLFIVLCGLVFLALEGWSLVAVVRSSRQSGAGEGA